MNANKGLITALLTVLLAAPAWAQVYRWVDQKGTVNYSNGTPPRGVQAAKVDIEFEPRVAPYVRARVWHASQQLREGAVRPKQRLRAVGHVFMAERPGAHGLQHRAARLAREPVVDAQRNSVSVALVAGGAPGQRPDLHGLHGRAVHRLEVGPQRVRSEGRVQCDISTGTVMVSSSVRVTPPSTSSRRREWP